MQSTVGPNGPVKEKSLKTDSFTDLLNTNKVKLVTLNNPETEP